MDLVWIDVMFSRKTSGVIEEHLLACDVATGWRQVFPLRTRAAKETAQCLREFAGTTPVKAIQIFQHDDDREPEPALTNCGIAALRGDDAREFLVAARELGRDDLRPSEVSRFWAGRTAALVREEPGSWLRTMGNKLRYALNGHEVPNNRYYAFTRGHSLLLRAPLPPCSDTL